MDTSDSKIKYNNPRVSSVRILLQNAQKMLYCYNTTYSPYEEKAEMVPKIYI